MTTIDTLYYIESSRTIYHYATVADGAVARLIDYNGSNWLSTGGELLDYSDEQIHDFPATVPVYRPDTGALHGRVHISAAGDMSYWALVIRPDPSVPPATTPGN